MMYCITVTGHFLDGSKKKLDLTPGQPILQQIDRPDWIPTIGGKKIKESDIIQDWNLVDGDYLDIVIPEDGWSSIMIIFLFVSNRTFLLVIARR